MTWSVICQELDNLETFRGTPNIVQTAGIAVSTNPYMTSDTKHRPLVVVGIVLESYSGGSLEMVPSEHCLFNYLWKRWATQIWIALYRLQQPGNTHSDIKPSDVALDADGNAVLIDISGIGGMTYDWRSSEARDETLPNELPNGVRLPNDAWAYGKLLSELVRHLIESPSANMLKRIADCLVIEKTHISMTLCEAILEL
ncbi:serine/threonine protein kinase [Penicillium sp. IBT 31633x]|nr:serine/threonine protein kinase [Penicillium sp. IBT 31633x]